MRIRLKPNIYIRELEKEILFVINPFEGVRIIQSVIIEQLIKLLDGSFTEKEVIINLSNEFDVDKETFQTLITKLWEKKIIEHYEQSATKKYERYDRQLNFFDLELKVSNRNELHKYQDKLLNSHVVLLGVGGIGNYAALALSGAGVGKITLIDDDDIELSNLNRQILFTPNDIASSKVNVVQRRLLEFSPKTEINIIKKKLHNFSEAKEIFDTISDIDLIFLSADEPQEIAYWIDSYNRDKNVPFIKCGYLGNFGVISPIIVPPKTYENIYGELKNKQEENACIKNWNSNMFKPPSMAATNGIIANIASLEVIKFLLNLPSQKLEKRLMINLFDFKIQHL